jgi:hypothetical protein
MKLEKGYTKDELNAFMQQAFREKKRFRRTADGGWETYEREVRSDERLSQEAVVPEVAAVPEAPAEKKNAWKRFKSLFVKN